MLPFTLPSKALSFGSTLKSKLIFAPLTKDFNNSTSSAESSEFTIVPSKESILPVISAEYSISLPSKLLDISVVLSSNNASSGAVKVSSAFEIAEKSLDFFVKLTFPVQTKNIIAAITRTKTTAMPIIINFFLDFFGILGSELTSGFCLFNSSSIIILPSLI